MFKYANTIGMEKGTSSADNDSVLAAITATFKKNNMCDFCDANLCLSRVKGGVSKCVSKWDSTFDIEACKASDGPPFQIPFFFNFVENVCLNKKILQVSLPPLWC